jgi:hypothetical protein
MKYQLTDQNKTKRLSKGKLVLMIIKILRY